MGGKALILIVAWTAFVQSCGNKSPRIKPQVSDITESVYASATVRAVDQYNLFSEVNGILTDVRVKPGDLIKKGSVLFILDNNTASLNTRSAQLSLELSEENYRRNSDKLRESELKMRLAYEQYRLDSSLYLRQKRLWDQKIGSELDFDQRRFTYLASKNNYEAARRQYRLLKTELKNDLEKARVNYDINRKIEQNFRVESEISGKVFDVLVEKGDLVTTQTPLAVLGRSDNFLLEMQVDENDISRIRTGQLVEITMDSFSGQVFEGKVYRIYPILNERSRTFQVDARFLDPPPGLYPNLTAEANIIVKTKKNALVIPRNFLEDDQYVWIAKNKKQKVITGLKDYKKVEILSGLDTSQYIYMPAEK